MPLTARSSGFPFLVAATVLGAAAPAFAQDTCITAYEGAQEARHVNDFLRSRAEARLCEHTCPKKLSADCSAWLREVEGQITTVILSATDPDGKVVTKARVSVDGAPVASETPAGPIELNPGEHRLTVENPSGARVTSVVTLAPGERGHKVAVRFAEVPAIAPTQPVVSPSPKSRAPYIVGGIGVAGLAAGAVLGIKGQIEKGALAGACAPRCDKHALVDPIANEWWAGAIAAGVGTVAVGTAILLLLLDDPANTPRVMVVPTLNGAAVVGRF